VPQLASKLSEFMPEVYTMV